MKKFLLRLGLRILKKTLKKGNYRGDFVEAINKRVDIPKMTEIQERKLFTDLYNTLADALLDIVDNI